MVPFAKVHPPLTAKYQEQVSQRLTGYLIPQIVTLYLNHFHSLAPMGQRIHFLWVSPWVHHRLEMEMQ